MSDAEIRDTAWKFLTSQREEIYDLFSKSTTEDPARHLVFQLLLYLGERGRAVLALLSADMDWDAEIVLRTYYECASKILYLCLSPSTERERLVHEFEVILAEGADKKRARKAKLAERAAREESEGAKDVFRLMHDPKMIRSTTVVSKAERQAVEARWSFSGIVEQLSKVTILGGLREIESLLHMYGMASHLVHSDAGALDLMTDRALRSESDQVLVKRGHRARILSDVVSLGLFCSHSAGVILAAPTGWMRRSHEHADATTTLARVVTEEFYVSQREFYDRMLRPKP